MLFTMDYIPVFSHELNDFESHFKCHPKPTGGNSGLFSGDLWQRLHSS